MVLCRINEVDAQILCSEWKVKKYELTQNAWQGCL